jgi:hypothetical protein
VDERVDGNDLAPSQIADIARLGKSVYFDWCGDLEVLHKFLATDVFQSNLSDVFYYDMEGEDFGCSGSWFATVTGDGPYLVTVSS